MEEWSTLETMTHAKLYALGLFLLKLKEGSTKLLRNGRHVPKLQTNLIFLGMLDSIRCKTARENGMIYVIKDTKVVLSGEIRNEVLCY